MKLIWIFYAKELEIMQSNPLLHFKFAYQIEIIFHLRGIYRKIGAFLMPTFEEGRGFVSPPGKCFPPTGSEVREIKTPILKYR
jgi:hypothetical protein